MKARRHIRGWYGAVSVIATVMMLAMIPATAGAVALTWESPGSQIFQQTLNSPCIIGDPSCNNPAGFGFTLLAVSPAGTTLVSSPTYTVGQITGIVGNAFIVGLDINQATQNVPAYSLIDNPSFAFTLNIDGGAPEFTLVCGTTCVSTLVNNGNGFSDALIRGFDLSGFDPSLNAVFTVSYINDTDGREEFFIIPGNATPVPEPTTLLLVGTLLAGLGVVARRGLKGPSSLPA